MKHIFTISLCFLALSLSAQETITYPYNPDGDADGLVAVPDIQDLLSVYGNPFSPAEIMVGDTALSEWIQILYQALQDQQAVIESMQGAGGCNYAFPDGIYGEPLSYNLSDGNYTVPENKTYYITSLYNMSSTNIMIDGVEIALTKWNDSSSQSSGLSLSNPIIVGSGQTISYGIGNATSLNGFLINEFVDPITIGVVNSDYIVPNNKTLYITQALTSGWPINIDGIQIIGRFFNNDGNGVGITLDNPVIVKAGQTVSSYEYVTNVASFNGYLVDEDYFADCGGGGSSGDGSIVDTDDWTCGQTWNYLGYDYETIQIGYNCWFAENLRAEVYTNGDSIPNNLSDEEWSSTWEGAITFYNQDSSIIETRGYLYNWYATQDYRDLCPTGWVMPTLEDWSALQELIGGYNFGYVLKNTPSDVPPWNGTNELGFNAVFSGYRNGSNGGFGEFDRSHIWSSTFDGEARRVNLFTNTDYMDLGGDPPRAGMSVRCIKD